ncbi:MAG: cytidine deaminase [Muribaculaceae bacterium]|nr:cytidine deaminase [Muribaculaceae bacterium]
MKERLITLRLTERRHQELDTPDSELVAAAQAATDGSYAPYSRFHVGAAIRLDDGTIVTGANQENAAFPSGICAERTAAYYAGAKYPDKKFQAIAIAAREGDSEEMTDYHISPCAACRQTLLEYEKLAGKGVRVLMVSRKSVLEAESVASLVPLAFTSF